MRRSIYVIATLLSLTVSVTDASAQSLSFNLSPAIATTAGGTVVRFTPPFGVTISSITIAGEVVAPVPTGDGRVVVIAPSRDVAGAVDFVVTATNGTTGTRTLTYVDFPTSGLATPIERLSVTSTGEQATIVGYNGNGSRVGALSADGRTVVMHSDATDLAPGQALYGASDIYFKNRETGALTYAGYCNDCSSTVSSLDGSRIAFRQVGGGGSGSVWVKDGLGTPVSVDRAPSGAYATGSVLFTMAISGDGRYLAFAHTAFDLDPIPVEADRNTMDLFVADLQTNVIARLTLGRIIQGLTMSTDGRFIVVATSSPLLPDDTNTISDLYLIDRTQFTGSSSTAGISLLVAGNGNSLAPRFSTDGGYIAFQSSASDLVEGDTNGVQDVFVLDMTTRAVSRASVATNGTQANAATNLMDISGNGRRILFSSTATSLASADPPSTSNLFVRDRLTEETWLVDADANGVQQDATATTGRLLPDGTGVLFSSLSGNLVPGDTNAIIDVFLKALPADTPAGSNVEAVPVDPATGETPVALSFAAITTPGNTSVTYTETAPPLPAGFLVGSRYVDITTTAVFSGTITVCVEYDPTTTPDPAALQLLHYEGGAWVNITTGFDAVAHVVCGQTTSLSPFVLAIPPRVTYTVRSLLEEGRVFKAGSTIPIRLQILEGGANVSAADLPLAATGVRLVSTQTDWATPEDPGQSNPDRTFQFTDVEGERGYRFNLKTTGLTAGTYELQFRVGTEGPLLSVEFQVR
jgi:Tol biopolymer transport system component